MNKSEEIRAILSTRYPCQAVPFRALSDIARDLNCSRELVRQQAAKLNYGKQPHTPIRKFCACGQELLGGQKQGKRCSNCQVVTLFCSFCGKEFQRTYITFISACRNAERLSTPHNIYCSRKCLGAAHGKLYGWGAAWHKKSAV